MAIVDLVMPKLGESIMEATILRWNKKPGDHVKVDETVLEIATDKVDSEVPSSVEGTIVELLYNENDVVPIDAVIARIQSDSGAHGSNGVAEHPVAAEKPQEPEQQISASIAEDEAAAAEVPYQPAHVVVSKSSGARFYSPLVLNIAANEGVSLAELEKIPGSGNEGRVTKKDILQWIAARKEQPAPAMQPAATVEQTSAAKAAEAAPALSVPASSSPEEEAVTEYTGNVEIVEMDRMRKMIAKHMVESRHTSAHVTSFTECDVTGMVQWREKIKAEFALNRPPNLLCRTARNECRTRLGF